MKCTRANSLEHDIDSRISESVISCDDIESRLSNTESSLLSSTQNSSEEEINSSHHNFNNLLITNHHTNVGYLKSSFNNIHNCNNYEMYPKTRQDCCRCGSGVILVTTGVIFILGSIFSLIYTPFEIAMIERLRMTPGLPPYAWWKVPPDEVLLKFYVFNITNIEEFTNGTDTKLKIQEIGPIIYREKLTHSNVTFNENGTMTYIAKREAIYLPEMNTIDINSTLIVPNFAVLGGASFMADTPFLTRFGLNLLMRRLDSQPYKIISIYDFLWNMTDPLLDVGSSLLPSIIPTKNIGILNMFYHDFVDQVTVRIGTKYGNENFFKIDTFRGSQYIFGDPDICEDKITGSTEGVLYNQFITKQSELLYWRKSVCRVMPLNYEHDTEKYGISAYKFTLRNDTLYRKNGSDCYTSESMPLLDGLSDASMCYFDFPLVSSFPHFLVGDKNIKSLVEGLKPNNSLHSSYIIVDPVTGIPLEGHARLQSNLLVKKLSGFSSKLDKYSDSVIPMFWIEYHQVGLPWYVQYLIIFTVQILPNIQYFGIVFFIILGLYLVYSGLSRRKVVKKTEKCDLYIQNQKLQFEQENMLKQCTT